MFRHSINKQLDIPLRPVIEPFPIRFNESFLNPDFPLHIRNFLLRKFILRAIGLHDLFADGLIIEQLLDAHQFKHVLRHRARVPLAVEAVVAEDVRLHDLLQDLVQRLVLAEILQELVFFAHCGVQRVNLLVPVHAADVGAGVAGWPLLVA